MCWACIAAAAAAAVLLRNDRGLDARTVSDPPLLAPDKACPTVFLFFLLGLSLYKKYKGLTEDSKSNGFDLSKGEYQQLLCSTSGFVTDL